jgi:hypothetical protein
MLLSLTKSPGLLRGLAVRDGKAANLADDSAPDRAK